MASYDVMESLEDEASAVAGPKSVINKVWEVLLFEKIRFDEWSFRRRKK